MIAQRKLFWRGAIVAGFVLLIAVISIHDAALVVVNDEVIVDCEQNPIGRWMLDIADGQVFLFVAAKLIGTTTVCATILAMLRYWPRRAVTISSAVACFQIGLLTYLTTF